MVEFPSRNEEGDIRQNLNLFHDQTLPLIYCRHLPRHQRA